MLTCKIGVLTELTLQAFWDDKLTHVVYVDPSLATIPQRTVIVKGLIFLYPITCYYLFFIFFKTEISV